MEGILQYISGFRSRIGVQQNRLEHTADNESNDWEGLLMGLRAARFEGTGEAEAGGAGFSGGDWKLQLETTLHKTIVGNYGP